MKIYIYICIYIYMPLTSYILITTVYEKYIEPPIGT
jgi:hypothetical protein